MSAGWSSCWHNGDKNGTVRKKKIVSVGYPRSRKSYSWVHTTTTSACERIFIRGSWHGDDSKSLYSRQTSRTRYRPFSLDWMVHQAKAAGLRITTPSSIAERVPRLLIFPEGRSSPCPDWSLNIMSKFYNPVSYIKSKAVVERRHKSNKYG